MTYSYPREVHIAAEKAETARRIRAIERERDAALLRVRLLERQIDELMGLAIRAVEQRDAARELL